MPELEVLGQCDRRMSCTTQQTATNITRQLTLLNGELLNDRITSPAGRLARMIESEKSHEEIVCEIYPRALSRPPTDQERRFWNEQLAAPSPEQRRARLEDFLWSVLNCNEFTHRY